MAPWPRTRLELGDLVQRDAAGFILSGPISCGDGKRPSEAGASIAIRRCLNPACRESSSSAMSANGSVKRVASGVGEGAVAIQFVHQYLAKVS